MSQFPFQPQQTAPSQGQPQPYGQPAYPAHQPYQDPGYQQAYQPQQVVNYPPQPQTYPSTQANPYGYGQQPPAPQQYQGPPPVAGTLDAFNSQPIGGGGPTLSFKDAPIGQTWTGTVARDVADADVQQDTDYKTKAPLFFRDGRPRLVMVVPVVLDQASQRHPDGRASVYIKSGLREAWAAGMSAAGVSGPPKAGDQFQITLTGQKDTGQGNPKNIFGVQYHRPGAEAPAAQPQAAPAQVPAYASEPVQPPSSSTHQNPVPQPVQQAPAQPQGIDTSALVAGMTPEQQAFLERLQAQQG